MVPKEIRDIAVMRQKEALSELEAKARYFDEEERAEEHINIRSFELVKHCRT